MKADFLWYYTPDMTKEQKWQSIRGYRDGLINKVQWMLDRHNREQDMIAIGTGLSATTLNDDQILQVYLYIQTLADIPQSFENADDVVFPEFIL